MSRLVAIIGPTATGKSLLALHLAQKFNAEIIGADSRQVYRHIDIGTAKPNRAEMTLVPHHLIGIINPDENFSLAQYQRQAYQKIEDIQRRGRLPLLVGGSGLYAWTVIEGWQIPEVAPDLEFRRHLEDRAARGEAGELYEELARIAPDAAERIDGRNVRRVIRALEVAQSGSSRPHMAKIAPPFQTLIIGLNAERKELYRRIDERVDGMIEAGLIDEVKGLLAKGYKPELPAMSGIGYRQACLYLSGGLSLEDTVRQIKTETHRLVRRQYNWFRLTDERIKWFDITESGMEAEVEGVVGEFISK